jgi:hypothetical protein
MKSIPLLFFFTFIVLIESCTPVTTVKPLEVKQKAISAHLGGPMIKFGGIPIATPLTSLGFAYGLHKKFTVSTNLGVTSLAFGVFQLDPCLLYGIHNPTKPGQPGISAFVKTHLILDRWEKHFRWYPEVGGQVYKEWGKNLFYLGGSGWFETRYPRQERSAVNVWIPMVHLGFIRQNPKWNLSLEMKWIAPNISHKNIVVDYIGPAGQGALGLYFGVTRKF